MVILLPYLAIVCQLCVDLSQNWDPDGHFEVLNQSKSKLVQYLWHKTQKCKKGKCVFLYKIAKHQKWKYLHFVSTTLEPIKF